MAGPVQTELSNGSLLSANSTAGHEIEVLCACDDRYLPHAATMLCSLLEHNSVSRIHLFYSSIASRELAKLKSLVGRYGSDIAFYEIVEEELQDLRVDKWASIVVYYQLLAARLLPTDLNKILYLDCDVIVRRSLNDLWNIDITDHALAAASDYANDAGIEALGLALGFPAGTKYFNSGVLLINLRFWRQNNVAERSIAFVKKNPEKIKYWDQDALNATLVHQWIELPACWNWQDWLHTSDPAVVHFISADRPWRWSSKHPFKHEYHKYRLKTPWGRYKSEGRPPGPLRIVARAVLPGGVRQWLRSRLTNS